MKQAIRHKLLAFALMGPMVLALFAALYIARPVFAQNPANPDVHFTFDINADGSNSVLIEVAVNPLLDPLLRQGLKSLKGFASKRAREIEITETTRDGRTYNALIVHFDSLGDLNAFINTPQMLSGLLASFAFEARIPSLFSSFSATSENISDRKAFRIEATIDAGTTEFLRFLNLTFHVRMPFDVQSHNAPIVQAQELTWPVTPGEPLIMSVTAIASNMIITSNMPLLMGLGFILLLIIVVVGFILYQRSQKTDYDPWADW